MIDDLHIKFTKLFFKGKVIYINNKEETIQSIVSSRLTQYVSKATTKKSHKYKLKKREKALYGQTKNNQTSYWVQV